MVYKKHGKFLLLIFSFIPLCLCAYFGWAWMDTQKVMDEVSQAYQKLPDEAHLSSEEENLKEIFGPNREGLNGATISTIKVWRYVTFVLGSWGYMGIEIENEITEPDGTKVTYRTNGALFIQRRTSGAWQVTKVEIDH